MAYDIDLRKRVIQFVRSGGSKTEAARIFGINRDTIYDWLSRKTLNPMPSKTRNRKIDKDALKRHVEEHPDALLRERAAYFDVHIHSIWHAMRKMGYRKKKSADI